MEKETRCLHPGDRVRVKQDRGELILDRPEQIVLIATKGSTGIVVSFEEYYSYYKKRLGHAYTKNPEAYEKYFLSVKKAIDTCFRYPIRFEKVMPPSEPADTILCKVGEIQTIDTYVLEKIE